MTNGARLIQKPCIKNACQVILVCTCSGHTSRCEMATVDEKSPLALCRWLKDDGECSNQEAIDDALEKYF